MSPAGKHFWGVVGLGGPSRKESSGPGACPLCKRKRLDWMTLEAHQNTPECREGQGMLVVRERGLVRAGGVSEWLLDSPVPLVSGREIHPGLHPNRLFAEQWAVELAGIFTKLLGKRAREAVENGEVTIRPAQIRELAKHVLTRAWADEKWRRAVLTSFRVAGAKDTLQLLVETLPRKRRAHDE